ncbi:MAG: trypsin-like peptidase domain-containing protein [Gemmatimonadota bacterium]|nr:MAG: trypsin-like peptidase domain-containing protein [Gemmatimonadota bacterium]
MSDPLRSKLRFVLFTALALALGLGLASGFHWAKGGEAATTANTAPQQFETPANLTETATPELANEPEVGAQQPATVPAALRELAEVSQAFVAIAQTVTPAVVSVDTRGTPQRARLPQRFEELFGPQHPELDTPYDVPLGRGSGFIVSDDGYVITNNHVVAAAERITVQLPDGRQFQAELVGRDPTTDIAVLKIDEDNLPTVKLGESETTAVGEFVLAVGNPGTSLGSELPFTVTAGIVSAKGRNLRLIQSTSGSDYAIEDLLQTDAVINPGNSGGPLVNYRGEVIGVNMAIQSTTGFYQGYGFAIPISLARDVMEDLIEYGRVRRAALRVQVREVTRADAMAFGLPQPRGAVVEGFPDDSPAEKAGIQRGDVIIAIDDNAVERVGQLQRVVASYEPDDRVSVTVIRYGDEIRFNVRLAEADIPQPEPSRAAEAAAPSNMMLGIQVADIDAAVRNRYGFDSDLQGVLVTRVAQYGPAWNAGLRQNLVIQRVNGTAIGSVADFDRALEEVQPGDVVSLDTALIDQNGTLGYRIINILIPDE